MRFIRTIATALLFFNMTLAFAQFSGSVKTDGAWNLGRSNNENAEVEFKYAAPQFNVGTGVDFSHSFLPSSQQTSILDAKKEKDQYYKGEDKTIDPRKFNAGAKLYFDYKFTPLDVLDASASYGFSGTGENSLLNTDRYNNNSSVVLNGVQKDTSYTQSHKVNFTSTYTRCFVSRPEAKLGVTVNYTTNVKSDANRRVATGSFYSKTKNYATYGSLNDFDSRLSVFYDDTFHFKSHALKMKAGLDLVSNQDMDAYCAETQVGGQWRDSTQYRQSYFYNSLATEPYINLTYSVGKFDFFVKERVQVYWHAMVDKLEDIKKPEDIKSLFDSFDTRNLLNAGITYRINPQHCVTMDYGRSVSRPDYKKLCPTLMIGKSEGEYFIGNPSLLPEITDKVNINYTYTKGIFVTSLDANYRNRVNTAEKVIDMEKSKDVTDPMVKTLYTWVNSKKQNSFSSKLDLKINGRDMKAEMWARFNYDIYWKNAAVDKKNFNYEIGTNIDVFLSKITKLSSSLAYISAKQSAYSMKGEDIVANLRFTVNVMKGMELYVELKDLVDKNIYEETWNADMNYLKTVSTNPMHRAALLGVKYSF